MLIIIKMPNENAMKLIKAQKIWDQAPHNAFTDLIRFRHRWFCVFREGVNHHSLDGALRIISSMDGNIWESVALLSSTTSDFRDGKLSISPDNRLMLCGVEVVIKENKRSYQSVVWYSEDGISWSKPEPIGDLNYWLWRVTWHEQVAYSVAYRCGSGGDLLHLYSNKNVAHFSVLAANLVEEGSPNEASLLFQQDRAYCLLRREHAHGLLGVALAPYTRWEWKDLMVRIGGPHFIALPDGRLLAAVRLYDGRIHTSLGWIDAETGRFTEQLALPSGGDTSYPGLVYYNERLWVSYYSSHEGKTAIYLAEVILR